MKNQNFSHPIRILKKGKYRFTCRRWPEECPGKILGVPEVNPKGQYQYKKISPDKVRIVLFDQVFEKIITEGDEMVAFVADLEPGETLLQTYFLEGEERYGVYYTYAELIN